LIGRFRVHSPSKSRSAVLTEAIWVAEDSSYNKTMPVFSAPVLKGEAIDAAEVLGVVGNDRPLMAEAGGGDENVSDADGRPLVEQSGIEAGGDPGAFGIEGLDL
jgi:hypothetical protein